MPYKDNSYLVVYHSDCLDGMASCLAIEMAKPTNISHTYFERNYGDGLPPVELYKERHVYIVDFSYPADVLMEMVKDARTITILDHHKTSRDDLKAFTARDEVMVWSLDQFEKEAQAWQRMRLTDNRSCFIRAKFDMDKAGAVLTWEHFHPGKYLPPFFAYIQDRDLWTRKLPGCDNFTWGLRSYPTDLQVWVDLIQGMNPVAELISEGEIVKRFFDLKMHELYENAHYLSIVKDGKFHDCLAVNAPYFFASDLAGYIAENSTTGWGVVYTTYDDHIKFSLRSRKGEDGIDPVDVGELAKGLSCTGRGGGHKMASGFEVFNVKHRISYRTLEGKLHMLVDVPRGMPGDIVDPEDCGF